MRSLIEKLENQLRQPWFGGGVGAVLTVFCGLGLLLLPIGKRLRDWSYDVPFLVRSAKTLDDVVIVYLDEKSYSTLGQDPATFDRSLHAQLLKRLQTDSAKMVVFDVLFIDTNRSLTSGDREFAKAMQSHAKVAIGGQY